MREREASFKEACQKKDKEYQDLAYVQTQGIEECQKLREERDTAKTALNQLKDELAAKDKSINNLKSQLEEKKTAIANLQTELEETRNELVSRETQLQQALQSVSPPVVVSPESYTTEELQSEIPLGVRQRLIEFVGERKSQAKDTRNWFQANKMIAELERILSIE
ncbi:hypothetical protein [Planktothrix sp. FACHB-1365]|uniref:hypothetical protein n=1 Tax=Planktothrix sp. FACHB-1365 TaxID=2692855 RepID=UPI0016872550|nr:hypothetical protein [Planktothrix sp. FACHB-1365]MBD2485827.1 hypothetical protein [Planktothrix sp. FACHB-1365]